MILLITVLAIFQTTDIYFAKFKLTNLSKKNICTICHRNVLAVESVHSSDTLFSPHTPSLTSPILHPPPPPQNFKFLCFPIDIELSVLEIVVSMKSKNFLRTTFRRGDCYRGNHGRKSHFVDGLNWLEPNNIVLVGELPCLVKYITNSAASTAVYSCDLGA